MQKATTCRAALVRVVAALDAAAQAAVSGRPFLDRARITLHLQPDHVPVVTSHRVIADGFADRTDPNALVVGPAGVGLGRNGVLDLSDSNENRSPANPNALTRATVRHGGVYFGYDADSRPFSNSLQLMQR